MAATSRGSEQGMLSGINVTPLVDIMLVLLVIFMVTAKLMVSQALPMDLPKAATGGEQQTVFAVAIDPRGALTVDSRPVATDRQLAELARSAKSKSVDLRAVIHADTSVPHGRVVKVMDLLRQGGIGKIAFGVTSDVLESDRS
jgi:biopolymer transport protein ExbD